MGQGRIAALEPLVFVREPDSMRGDRYRVLIVVPTLGTRPINDLLHRLRLQECDAASIRVVVLHNVDQASTADGRLQSLCLAEGAEYVLIRGRGYATVRNSALALAENADWIVFIDDDELPERNWIRTHMRGWEAWGADVSSGPVKTVVPSSAPRWLAGGQTIRPIDSRPEGLTTALISTANTALRVRFFAIAELRFDTAFDSSGGEDTDLFARARAEGARIVWLPDAQVIEMADVERRRVSYVVRRSYRSGYLSTALSIQRGEVSRGKFFVRKIAQLAFGTVCVFGGLLVGDMAGTVRGLKTQSAALGCLAALLRVGTA